MSEYVGLDVSKDETAFCVKDAAGSVLAAGKAASDPGALFEVLKEHCLCPERIVIETGALTPWLARGLRARGLEVTVIDARQAHAVMRLQHQKTDAGDAALLCEIARTGFCQEVVVKPEEAQENLGIVKARSHLVRRRQDLENVLRGLMNASGLRFPKGRTRLLAGLRQAMRQRPDLEAVIAPLLSAIAALEQAAEKLEAVIRERAGEDPASRLLMTVPGVGPMTALSYVSVIGEAGRFRRSRAVGAYLGLATRRYQSGEMDYSGRVSKQGDRLLRALLYEAANNMLTVVRRSHPLKDWARRLKRRSSHKKACVALARKLAVLMHRMLANGESFRWPEATPA